MSPLPQILTASLKKTGLHKPNDAIVVRRRSGRTTISSKRVGESLNPRSRTGGAAAQGAGQRTLCRVHAQNSAQPVVRPGAPAARLVSGIAGRPGYRRRRAEVAARLHR
ncbi:hypothetical protein Asi03nite_25960 [Actinoplanes siamensis]|uniref:Uncharacterized protein n=1 Tax=Actinoplanes siamensis TaxID=1223317 RepID=A0A919N634_9ACTN|nr:hypothetical protein Asi03nite_25960 [Actinoplanes siamensis]